MINIFWSSCWKQSGSWDSKRCVLLSAAGMFRERFLKWRWRMFMSCVCSTRWRCVPKSERFGWRAFWSLWFFINGLRKCLLKVTLLMLAIHFNYKNLLITYNKLIYSMLSKVILFFIKLLSSFSFRKFVLLKMTLKYCYWQEMFGGKKCFSYKVSWRKYGKRIEVFCSLYL